MNRLSVPAQLDALSLIREYVTTAAQQAGLDKTLTYRLKLAVDEIATNIITHGYKEAGSRGVIDVMYEIDAAYLTIWLEDSGATYDASKYQTHHQINLPLEDRVEGGLGVYIAMKIVDQFEYGQVGERNRHTFRMKRAGRN